MPRQVGQLAGVTPSALLGRDVSAVTYSASSWAIASARWKGSRSRLRPDGEFVAARVSEVEAAAAGEGEGLLHDPATGVLDPLQRVVEGLRIDDDQGTSRAHVGCALHSPPASRPSPWMPA